VSEPVFYEFIELGLPAVKVSGRWYAYADNIDEFYDLVDLLNISNIEFYNVESKLRVDVERRNFGYRFKRMVFEGNIDETEVGKIKEGMPLILVIGAIEDIEFEASLEHISPKGVEVNGAVQFEIKADVVLLEDQFIRSGYSANANIVLDKADSVLAISESLLQFENDTVFVEIETSPQVFEKRYIKTGLSDGINIEVIEGLSKDDKIKKQN